MFGEDRLVHLWSLLKNKRFVWFEIYEELGLVHFWRELLVNFCIFFGITLDYLARKELIQFRSL